MRKIFPRKYPEIGTQFVKAEGTHKGKKVAQKTSNGGQVYQSYPYPIIADTDKGNLEGEYYCNPKDIHQ